MKNSFTKSNFVVCLFFGVLSFLKGIGLASSSKVYLIIYSMVVFLILLKFFQGSFKRREVLILLSLLVCGLLDFLFGKETTILFSAIGLLTLKDEKLDRIIKVMFWTRLFAFLLMIVLPICGVIPMNTLLFYRNGEYINRYAFGYVHPNLVHSTFGLLVLLFIYSYYEKINLPLVVFIEFLNYSLEKFTFSRTGFLIISLIMIVFLIIKKYKKAEHALPKILNLALFVIILVSFSLALMYNKVGFVKEIDILLTGRIRYMNIMFTEYKIPLFKHQIYTDINFDNGFCDLLFNGGLFAFFIILILQVKTNKFIKKNNMIKQSVITLFMFIYCFTESYYMSFLMNPSLLFFSYIIFNSNKELKNNEI